MNPLARAYVLVLTGAFAAHFFLVFFSAMPVNPISLEFRRPIVAYVNTLFMQNWALFGPSPPDTDLSVLAQYRLERDGRTVDTPWIDLSQALRGEVVRNPVTPLAVVALVLNRTSESLSNAHAQIVPGQDYDLNAPSAPEVAARIAVAYERTLHLDGTLRAARTALVVHRYPRFSERTRPNDPTRDSVRFDNPWYRDVAVPDLARFGR